MTENCEPPWQKPCNILVSLIFSKKNIRTFFCETNTLPLHSEVNGGSHTPTGPIAVQVVILQLYFSWSIIMVWFGAQEQLTLLAYSVTYRSQVRLDHLRRGGHATTKQKRRTVE